MTKISRSMCACGSLATKGPATGRRSPSPVCRSPWPLTPADRWTEKLVVALRSYSTKDLTADTIAGVTVGLVALPLAMAFGVASGVAPQVGLCTAVITGFLISVLGGLARPDRRADGRVRRRHRRHHREVRDLRFAYGHRHGGRPAHRHGSHRARHRRSLHSEAGDHRVHERRRVVDRDDPDQGFPRPAFRGQSQRLLRPHASARPSLAYDARSDRPDGNRVARGRRVVAALGSTCARDERRRRRRHGCGRRLLPADRTIGTRNCGIATGLPPVAIPQFRADNILPNIEAGVGPRPRRRRGLRRRRRRDGAGLPAPNRVASRRRRWHGRGRRPIGQGRHGLPWK
ncbi:MAG: hypothetical protein FJX78_10420 [Armatimonadetes bacterium]|nr:hypothetical protein [Armatimonadota bacterium]